MPMTDEIEYIKIYDGTFIASINRNSICILNSLEKKLQFIYSGMQKNV